MPLRPPIHKPFPYMRDERRTKKADPFYRTPEWKELRTTVLRERGYVCAEGGPACGRANHVDHIISINNGGAKLDKKNVQVLCHSHHSSKTARCDQGRGDTGGFGMGQRRPVARPFIGIA